LTGFENKTFSLLWRGSRDGFDAGTFHRLCDGKGNTVTVIKSTEDYIFGGYTEIPWSSENGYKRDRGAFLFSLTNPSENPFKFRVNDSSYAVYHSSYGPAFGDLFVGDQPNVYRDSSLFFDYYESPNGKYGEEGGQFILGSSDNKFETAEIEVFQVV